MTKAVKPTLTAAASLPSLKRIAPALRKQVTQGSCRAIPHGWQLSGVVHNTGKSARTFNIRVFFTTPQATVINTATAAVRVAAGKTAKWTASKKFTTEPGMRCVIVGVT